MRVLNRGIPTVMFHSLKYSLHDDFYLSFRSDYLVEVIRELLRRGYEFVTIEDIVLNRCGRRCGERRTSSRGKYVCFTFDDGFEDNYSVLFPVLTYFGVPVTIFISSDFVASDEHDTHFTGSRWLRKFLTRKQIAMMHRSGLVDFQGHSRSHTWLPASGRVDEVCPLNELDKHYWIYWNRFPDFKTSATRQAMLALEAERFAVFDHGRALNCRRFIPEHDEFYPAGIGVGDVVSGHLESVDEQRARYESEILGDKKSLEALLDKQLCYLCWPGGEFDAIAYDVFRSSGYRVCSLPSSQAKRLTAEKILDPTQAVVARLSSSCVSRELDMGPTRLVYRVLQYSHPNRLARAWSKLRHELVQQGASMLNGARIRGSSASSRVGGAQRDACGQGRPRL